MTTPDTTTTAETNRTTDRTRTADASSRPIPGRTPITEEAGAPIVPTTRTSTEGTTATEGPTATDAPRRPSPPPTDAERDAPLVPDLRPTRRPRTDGGSR